MANEDLTSTPSWPAAQAAKAESIAAPNDNVKRATYTALLKTCAAEAGIIPTLTNRKAT